MNKNKIYLLSYILLIGLSLVYTNKYTIIIPPLILFVLIFYLYKNEIRQFNFNNLFKDRQTSNWIFKTFMIAFWGQFLLNFILSHLFHTEPHTLSQSVMYIPTTGLYAVIFAAIGEEIIFRRIIFGWLNTKLNFWIAALISSIIFASGHGLSIAFFGYVFVGMVFCWYYKKSGIETTIVAHMYINFLAVLSQSLLMQNIHN